MLRKQLDLKARGLKSKEEKERGKEKKEREREERLFMYGESIKI